MFIYHAFGHRAPCCKVSSALAKPLMMVVHAFMPVLFVVIMFILLLAASFHFETIYKGILVINCPEGPIHPSSFFSTYI